ncbi:MAG TPA: cupin domain-containing protein [Mycobacterium sp.]|nr:cupin domain-containing protein [Mycobacterium sp.]
MSDVRWLAPASMAVILVSLGSAAAASATPGIDLGAETLSQATVDGHDYVTKQITIAPGGSTGWHWHPGRVFGVIRKGTLTHNVEDCSVDGIYPPGSPITEGSGPDDVHLGRNLGSDPVVMWVVYIDAAGDPLSVDVPNPGCPFE